MNNPFRILIAALLLAVFAGAALPGAAFADDGEPPVTEEPAPPPDDGGEPAAEEPTAEEPTAAEETPAADEGELVESDAPAEESLPALPEGTELIVLDENGEPLPLASQEAAELIEIIDPMWCPVGVTPGSGSCTDPYPNLWELIDDIATGTIAQPSANGVIWIQGGPDSSTADIVIDGTALNFTTWKNYSLTLKGGWSGGNNTSINTANPSEFSFGISILNWGNDITLSDIIIETNSTAGLDITTSGKVTLTRVEVNNSAGAEIDNTLNGGTKDVVIASSEFSGNNGSDYDGLNVLSNGVITLSNVTAIDNGSNGATLDNLGGVAKGVNLTGTNIFGENLDDGLRIYSKGAIKINNLFASANGVYGAYLENDEATSAQPVTLTNSNEFKFNGYYGLEIQSNGAVTLNNITASNNINETEDGGGDGVLIDNRSTFAANVTLTGTNIFNDNFTNGLQILSKGMITLSNVTANGNGTSIAGGIGAWLDNSFADVPKSVILTGTNQFNENYGDGLKIDSKGAITLANITANDSLNGAGADLGNDDITSSQQNVTLTGVNTFNGNSGFGVDIDSFGTVSLAKVTANGNGMYGLEIENYNGDLPRNVLISGYGIFNDNEGGDGLVIDTKGTITVANLEASYNSQGGAELLNHAGTAGVTLTGTNKFYENINGIGLEIQSKGNITLSNVQAIDNGNNGATLDNCQWDLGNCLGSGFVTLTGLNIFSDNSGTGLDVSSRGNITLYNFEANSNDGDYGVLIVNEYATSIGNVSLITNIANWCNEIMHNDFTGLRILTNGTVAASNLCADDNGEYGVYIDNNDAGLPKAVTISGTNSMSENGYEGLFLLSKGAVTISNITASFNGEARPFHPEGQGIFIENYSTGNPLFPQNVTLNGYVEVISNFSNGLEVQTYGNILANNIFAQGNGWSLDLTPVYYGIGAYLNNNGGSLTRAVTLNGTNEFATNYTGGLLVESFGAIKVNNLAADFNEAYGADLSNTAGVGGVTISGHTWAFGNETYGLHIQSNGAISLTNADIDENGTYGANLTNTTGTAGVTLSGTYNIFQYNQDGGGLEIDTNGAVKINNLEAISNDSFGVSINNETASPVQPVTLTGFADISDNGNYGLYITSVGAITIANLEASGNGWDVTSWGAQLINTGGAGVTGGITLTGSNEFEANTGYGLSAVSNGPIKINNLTAIGNDTYGVFIDNSIAPSATATVTLTGTQYFYSNGVGLQILSKRLVTVNSVTSTENWGGNGVYIDNSYGGETVPADVKFTGTNVFTWNEYSGLEIYTYGAVFLNNISASHNGEGEVEDNGYGVLVINQQNGVTPAVTAKGLTLTGTNTFDDNWDDGLFAWISGFIKANNLNATDNEENGIYLDNQVGQAVPGAITLTGTSTFTLNNEWGLIAWSNRSITMNNVTANSNSLSGTQGGVNLNTSCGCNFANVILTGTNTFNYNGDYTNSLGTGLQVVAEGAITINNLTANGNGHTGADLTNYSPTLTKPNITLTGVNNFIGNKFRGLAFASEGNVFLYKVTADGTELGVGVVGNATGNITITCGSMTNNGTVGLDLTALGTITLKGVVSLGNTNGPSTLFPAVIVRSC